MNQIFSYWMMADFEPISNLSNAIGLDGAYIYNDFI